MVTIFIHNESLRIRSTLELLRNGGHIFYSVMPIKQSVKISPILTFMTVLLKGTIVRKEKDKQLLMVKRYADWRFLQNIRFSRVLFVEPLKQLFWLLEQEMYKQIHFGLTFTSSAVISIYPQPLNTLQSILEVPPNQGNRVLLHTVFRQELAQERFLIQVLSQ